MPLEIDMYLDNFIDNYDNKEELVGVIRNILLGKNVKGLEDYSKYVLSLSMEKKIMKCMEILHLNTNGKSMWNEVKSHAPNLFFESENIDKFIKMYLKHKGRKTVSEIETILSIEEFYNKYIINALKLEANKMYELPSGIKTSQIDITKAIVNLFGKKEKKSTKAVKLPNKARRAIITAGIITSIACTLPHINSKVPINDAPVENESDFSIADIGEENHQIPENENVEVVESIHVLSVPNKMEDGLYQSGISNNMTSYNKINWSNNSNQRSVYNMWIKNGSKSNRGIATLGGRYLVAVAPIFGQTGQQIDFVLEDGTVIKCMIADIKEEGLYNKWGHLIGNGVNDKDDAIDIIEWQAVVPKDEINLDGWKRLKVDHVVNYNMDYSNEKGVEMANGR